MYKPPPPQTFNYKNHPLNRSSKYKPPRGPQIVRLAQLILKCKFPSINKPLIQGLLKYKPQGIFSEFNGKGFTNFFGNQNKLLNEKATE